MLTVGEAEPPFGERVTLLRGREASGISVTTQSVVTRLLTGSTNVYTGSLQQVALGYVNLEIHEGNSP